MLVYSSFMIIIIAFYKRILLLYLPDQRYIFSFTTMGVILGKLGNYRYASGDSGLAGLFLIFTH